MTTKSKTFYRLNFSQSETQIKEYFNKVETKNSFYNTILFQFKKTPYRDTKKGMKYRYEVFVVNNELGYINSATYHIFCLLYTAGVKDISWKNSIPCSIVGLDGTEDVIEKVINREYSLYKPFSNYKLKFVQVAI